MSTLTLHTSTPCCSHAVRLAATDLVEHERYERTCRSCGSLWTIDRVLLVERNGLRADRFEWEQIDQ